MKKYIKPMMKAHYVAPIIMCCGSSDRHDNGKHNGWKNPNNPHYDFSDEE